MRNTKTLGPAQNMQCHRCLLLANFIKWRITIYTNKDNELEDLVNKNETYIGINKRGSKDKRK